MDRLDIHIQVPPVEVEALTRGALGESSATVRERVIRARKLQLERRRAGITRARNNAELSGWDLDRVANAGA